MKKPGNPKESQQTIGIADGYRRVLSPYVSQEMQESAIFIDLADIYEICLWYVTATDQVLKGKKLSKDALADDLIGIEVQMDHLHYHLKSLRKILPKVTNCLSRG